MQKWLKPGPFSSSFLGLGTRLMEDGLLFILCLRSLVPRPHPAFHRLQYGKVTESWAGPGNEANAYLPYSGKLSREKTFADCLLLPRQRTPCPKIRGENFCVQPQNHEIHESFLPRKFSAIRYVYTLPNAQSITFQILMTHFHSFYTYRQ